MDFYKDFPERSDAGTATTPDGSVVAGSDKLNDNDYAMVGANGTGSNSQGKGYKVKLSSIYNYFKSKLLGDSGMESSASSRGLMSSAFWEDMQNQRFEYYKKENALHIPAGSLLRISTPSPDNKVAGFRQIKIGVHTYSGLSFGYQQSCYEIFSPRSAWAGSSPVVFCYKNFHAAASYATKLYECRDSNDIRTHIEIEFSKECYINIEGRFGNVSVVSVAHAGPKNAYTLPERGVLCSYGFHTSGSTTQSLAASYIAERYTPDEEFAIQRRMIANDPTVVGQFEAYNTYCEECKARAKEELANQPQVLPNNVMKK